MRTKYFSHFFITVLLLSVAANLWGQVRGGPPDPIEVEKHARCNALIEQARVKIKARDLLGSIPILREAEAVEGTLRIRSTLASLVLAQVFVRLDRTSEALVSFKKSYIWDSASKSFNPVFGGNFHLDYAMLLAKLGRVEDAKAMYYHCLRMSGSKPRSSEPAPFLIVFDPESEGIVWEYSLQKFEAATLMLRILNGSHTTVLVNQESYDRNDLIEKVRDLAPDWFYPVLLIADRKRSPSWETWTATAESLAKPGLEREIMAQYRISHAEQMATQTSGARTLDHRPMTGGIDRRARMNVLKPNEEILKRLSTVLPNP